MKYDNLSKSIIFLDEDDDTVNFREVFDKYLFRWKWFVLGIAIMLVFAFLYVRYTPKQYQVQATILVNDKNTGSVQPELFAFKDLGIMSDTKSSFENELRILSSRSLKMQVIEDLKSNIIFFRKGLMEAHEVYKDEFPFKLNFLTNDSIVNSSDLVFKIIPISESQFSLEDDESEWIGEYMYGETISYNSIDFIITPIMNNIPIYEEEFMVTIQPIEVVVDQFKKLIKIEANDKKSNVINLSILYPIKQKAIDILSSLIEIYNDNAIVDKSMIATETNTFISERLVVISEDLIVLDKEVEVFKTTNKITDIQSEAGIVLTSNSSLEEKIVGINTQIKLVDYVIAFMANKTKELIPANLGLSDIYISQTTHTYNEILSERKRISKSSSPKNPIVINLDQQLKDLRSSINNSLVNLKSSFNISLQDFKAQERVFNSKIKSVPKQEREYREMQRQQQIIETLYLFLLQKREENSITLAVTRPNAKIIDRAYSSYMPVLPKPKKIYFLAIMLGLVIPFAFMYLISLFDYKVHTLADLENELKIPILGNIPQNKSNQNIVISKKDKNALTESFRMLRTNILFMLSKLDKQSKVIFVTSTINGEGKTFTALNLAAVLALSDKKVLLIGGDVRNPMLAKYLNVKEKEGLTHFLMDANNKAEDLIETAEGFGFDILQSGFIPPNPSELFMNGRFDEILNYGKENYDFIVVDTAPVSLVTDTMLLSQNKADLFIYVVRANYLDKRMLKIPKKLNATKQIENMAILLNDTKPERAHGYGYGYGQNASKLSWKHRIFRR